MRDKKIKLYFDMDGTIADLYNHENWLEKIRSGQPIFNELKKMPRTNKVIYYLNQIEQHTDNVEVNIITWLPLNATIPQMIQYTEEKKEWSEKNFVRVSNFIALPYGSPKHKAILKEEKAYHLLFDDNAEVRNEWQGKYKIAFDENNIVEVLRLILNNLRE